MFAVTVGNKTYEQETLPEEVISKPGLKKIKQMTPKQTKELSEAQESVPVTLILETSANYSYSLLKLLEMSRNTKARIVAEIRDDSGELARKKQRWKNSCRTTASLLTGKRRMLHPYDPMQTHNRSRVESACTAPERHYRP